MWWKNNEKQRWQFTHRTFNNIIRQKMNRGREREKKSLLYVSRTQASNLENLKIFAFHRQLNIRCWTVAKSKSEKTTVIQMFLNCKWKKLLRYEKLDCIVISFVCDASETRLKERMVWYIYFFYAGIFKTLFNNSVFSPIKNAWHIQVKYAWNLC